MSRVVEYKVEVFADNDPASTPYIVVETDKDLDVIRELLRALSDHKMHMARFIVTKTES